MSILKINPQQKVYFINYEDYFIGEKEFVLEEDGLYMNYFVKDNKDYKRKKYSFAFEKKFYGLKTKYEFIISEKSNHSRYLIFEIPIYYKNHYEEYQAVKKIKGGYRVDCFDTIEIGITKKKKYKLPVIVNIPVIFRMGAVNFFDGDSVLVNEFAFIPPDIFKQLEFPKKIKNLKAYDYYYNWIKEEIIK